MPIPHHYTRGSPHPKVSVSMRRFDRTMKVAASMRFDRSGLLPQSSEEFEALQQWYKSYKDDLRTKKTDQNHIDLEMAGKQNRTLAQCFDGKPIGDGNVGVLNLPTIWVRTWKPTANHPEAPWPSPREFCEEGDERHTSNYGRFLPIPRVPGNDTVNFKQKSLVIVEDLDKVMPVAKLYDEVNINAQGMFDSSIDKNGIPFDDHDAPGKECIIMKHLDNTYKNIPKTLGRKSSLKVNEHVDKAIIDDEVTAAPVFDLKPALRGSLLHPGAMSFIPSHIPALNPGKINDNINNNSSSFFVNGILSDLMSASLLTPDSKIIRPPRAGFTGVNKKKTEGRGNLRINTNVQEFLTSLQPSATLGDSAISAEKPTTVFKTMQEISPQEAFRRLNPCPSEEVVGGQIRLTSSNTFSPESATKSQDMVFSPVRDLRSDLTSPVELPATTGFSAHRPQAHRPRKLNLGRFSNLKGLPSALETSLDSDSSDSDGGVKLY